MSRALNLNASESEVRQVCTDHSIVFTSIEKLLPRGTRVVCINGNGSAVLRRKMLGKIIDGEVRRMPRALRTAP
jgi:UDP-2,3-diacylglucosamine pyrophosphatase LpxH